MAKAGMRIENLDPKIAVYTGAHTIVRGGLNRTFRRIAPIAIEALKMETPIGASKKLRNSTTGSIVGGPAAQRLEIRQGALSRRGSPYGRFVWGGTRPHWVPIGELVPWVMAVLGVSQDRALRVAYLVSRKIARVGTKPNLYPQRALKRITPQLQTIMKQEAVTIAARLNS